MNKSMQHLLSKLPERLQWSLHNLVGHPLSEVLYLVGCPERVYNWVHDVTIPAHDEGTGRG